MKEVMIMFFMCAMPISCFISAAFLAYHKKEGWGWLIFAGLMIASGIKISF